MLRHLAKPRDERHDTPGVAAALVRVEDTMTAPRMALVVATTFAAATVLTGPAPAYAKGGDAIRSSSACSTGVIKLKAKHDDGRIEVEVEVDTNRRGQVWSLTLKDNRVTVWQGRRTTRAPSGSFSVHQRIANRAGTYVITVRATRGSKVCVTRVWL